METVFVITRTCYGEDYPDPETDIEIFGTLEKAKERFEAILDEEENHITQDVGDEVIESEDGWYLDFTDPDDDYRVVMTLKEREVK